MLMESNLAVFALPLTLLSLCTTAAGVTLYVSTDGNDAWSGRLERPNVERTDGPLASLAGARDAIRGMRARGPLQERVRVLIADGRYTLTEPLLLTPLDSGTSECPITYEAAPGARPVFSGGRIISGFQTGPDGTWVVHIPEARPGGWRFEQLWVNGRRATRARSPNRFWHYTVGKVHYGIDPQTGQPTDLSHRAFRARPEDIASLASLSPEELQEVTVIAYHAWETSRHHVASVNAQTGQVILTGSAPWPMMMWAPSQRFHVEGLMAALDEPGEWFLDLDGTLYYKPLTGEDPATAEIVAPVVEQFVRIVGEPEMGLPVEHITLRGLRFHHGQYVLPPEGHGDLQAEVSMPAVVMVDGAEELRIERCEIGHVGIYGIWFRRGCRNCRVVRSYLHDLGCGGVKIGEAAMQSDPVNQTHHITVDNCIIHGGGRIYPGAIGVWIGQSSDNRVTHNDISDLFYSGVSVGWSWGYKDTLAKRNAIEFNHIHHLGQGVMSDMGAVYTLGISDGTTVSNNVIHDIYSYDRYGWAGLGLYNDEGSTHITIENNLVYHTKDMTYHQHYGKENVVRNNILALGREFQLSVHRVEPHLSVTFERNIVYWKTGKLFWQPTMDGRKVQFDNNVYWDPTGRPTEFFGMSFDRWRQSGQDVHSVFADPLFEDPDNLDFRLKPDSPALKLGFVPFDYTRAGVYGDAEWVALARSLPMPAYEPASDPPPAPPLGISEDFEQAPVGSPPPEAQVQVEGKGDSIGVTDDMGAGGSRRCLKIVDAPGLQYSFNPHFYYIPRHTGGVTRVSFDLRLEEGAEFWHEWRDASNPYQIGPGIQIVGGKLQARERAFGDFPMGRWVHIAISATLGENSTGTWTLEVTLPGQEPLVFADLPNVSPLWRTLDWLGFVSNATGNAVWYLDNLTILNEGS